jgi:hypothetical protein
MSGNQQHAAIKEVSQGSAVEEGDEDKEHLDEEEYEEDDELFDDEADEEAQAMAKQLGDALWADIAKVYTQQTSEQPIPTDNEAQSPSLLVPNEEYDDNKTLENAIQAVLDLAESHQMLHQALSNTIVPDEEAGSLLDVLIAVAGTRVVSPQLAAALSNLIQGVVDSETFR